MTRNGYILLAAGGSAAMLLGAFGFQHLGGLPPCELCLWQRWPHAAAILIGVLALVIGGRAWPWLVALAAAMTSGLGLYHTGVERHWWQGPTSCTGSGDALSGLSASDLLNVAEAPKVVMCDQVSWQMLGLSMPSWNAIISLVFVMLWLKAACVPNAR